MNNDMVKKFRQTYGWGNEGKEYWTSQQYDKNDLFLIQNAFNSLGKENIIRELSGIDKKIIDLCFDLSTIYELFPEFVKEFIDLGGGTERVFLLIRKEIDLGEEIDDILSYPQIGFYSEEYRQYGFYIPYLNDVLVDILFAHHYPLTDKYKYKKGKIDKWTKEKGWYTVNGMVESIDGKYIEAPISNEPFYLLYCEWIKNEMSKFTLLKSKSLNQYLRKLKGRKVTLIDKERISITHKDYPRTTWIIDFGMEECQDVKIGENRIEQYGWKQFLDNYLSLPQAYRNDPKKYKNNYWQYEEWCRPFFALMLIQDWLDEYSFMF